MKITFTHNELFEVAQRILKHATSRIFLFYGPMGVGKTTLIKEITKQLSARELTSSPTFSIVNEYEIPDGLVYHFDFYRIEDPREALDLGFEDYLYSGEYVFIEWPEKISGLLPEDVLKIQLKVNENGSRSVIIDPE